MTDGMTITIIFTLKPECLEGFLTELPELFKDTRKRPGFRDLCAVQNRDAPNRVMIFQTWDSDQAYLDYLAWRQQRGEMEALTAKMAAEAELAFWPNVIARINYNRTAASTLRGIAGRTPLRRL